MEKQSLRPDQLSLSNLKLGVETATDAKIDFWQKYDGSEPVCIYSWPHGKYYRADRVQFLSMPGKYPQGENYTETKAEALTLPLAEAFELVKNAPPETGFRFIYADQTTDLPKDLPELNPGLGLGLSFLKTSNEVRQVLRLNRDQVIVVESDLNYTSLTFSLGFILPKPQGQENRMKILRTITVYDDPTTFFQLVSEKIMHPSNHVKNGLDSLEELNQRIEFLVKELSKTEDGNTTARSDEH